MSDALLNMVDIDLHLLLLPMLWMTTSYEDNKL
jgi:hypothetical protein